MINMQNLKNFFFWKNPIETYHGKKQPEKTRTSALFLEWTTGTSAPFLEWKVSWAVEQFLDFQASSAEQWSVFGFNSWVEQYAAVFWIKKKAEQWNIFWNWQLSWVVIVFGLKKMVSGDVCKNKNKNAYGVPPVAKNTLKKTKRVWDVDDLVCKIKE